jgi:hypothetical protein
MSELEAVMSHPVWKIRPASRGMLVSLAMRISRTHAVAKGVQKLWDDGEEKFTSAQLAVAASQFYREPLSPHRVAYIISDMSKFFNVSRERDSRNHRWYVFDR